MSINKQLQWSTFFITAFSLLLLLIFSFAHYYQSLKSNLEADTQVTLDRSATVIEDKIDEVDILTEKAQFFSKSSYDLMSDLRKYQVGKTPSVSDYFRTEQEIRGIFRTLIYRMDYINFFALVLPTGKIISYSNTQKDFYFGYNPLKDSWYQETVAKQGALTISLLDKEHTVINNDESSTLLFSRGIYDLYSQQFLGIFTINCEPEFFNFAAEGFSEKVSDFSITDRTSQEVFYIDKSKQPLFHASLQKEINTRRQPLILTANLDTTEYMEVLRRIINYSLIILIAVLIIAFLSAKLFAEKFTKPIVSLSQDMNEKNRLDQLQINRDFLKRTDEIGSLYREFDQLLQAQKDYMKQKLDYEKTLSRSELNVYKNQIDSHFLYNTLESINSIAEMEDLDTISDMTVALSKMFRYASNGFVNSASLAEEIENVEDYLTIQRIRFQNCFDFIAFVHQSEIINRKVPKLILQPIVENALFHGLKGQEITGKIRLFITHQEGNLLIRVYDNGIGILPERLQELNQELADAMTLVRERSSHIGLINIQARIKNLYGLEYGLKIFSQPNKGTLVEIKLPLLEMEEDDV